MATPSSVIANRLSAVNRRASSETAGASALPASAVRRLTVVGVIALAFLNAADAVTTRLLLLHAAAGAVEANPLAKLLLASGWLLYAKLGIVALLGIAALRNRPRLAFLAGVWFVAGLYAAAVVSNGLLLGMV